MKRFSLLLMLAVLSFNSCEQTPERISKSALKEIATGHYSSWNGEKIYDLFEKSDLFTPKIVDNYFSTDIIYYGKPQKRFLEMLNDYIDTGLTYKRAKLISTKRFDSVPLYESMFIRSDNISTQAKINVTVNGGLEYYKTDDYIISLSRSNRIYKLRYLIDDEYTVTVEILQGFGKNNYKVGSIVRD